MFELDEWMIRRVDRNGEGFAVLAQVEIKAIGMQALKNKKFEIVQARQHTLTLKRMPMICVLQELQMAGCTSVNCSLGDMMSVRLATFTNAWFGCCSGAMLRILFEKISQKIWKSSKD
jgi:hypothetical protein